MGAGDTRFALLVLLGALIFHIKLVPVNVDGPQHVLPQLSHQTTLSIMSQNRQDLECTRGHREDIEPGSVAAIITIGIFLLSVES